MLRTIAANSVRSLRYLAGHPAGVKDLPAWIADWRHRQPLSQRQPWMSYEAIRHLESLVTPGSRVFEFGGGSSTLWFADRGAQVVTVEHDPVWADLLRARLGSDGITNVQLITIGPEPIEGGRPGPLPFDYGSSQGGNWERYARSIDEFPEGSFDVVVVDGRARPGCFKHAVARVRPGGVVVLDDADRPAYRTVERYACGWLRESARGIRARSDPSQTDFWTRP